jgi:hypothetical protein
LWQLLQLGHDAPTNEKGDRVAMFRTAAASFAAAYGRDYPHLASAVLGHIDPRVTEEQSGVSTLFLSLLPECPIGYGAHVTLRWCHDAMGRRRLAQSNSVSRK